MQTKIFKPYKKQSLKKFRKYHWKTSVPESLSFLLKIFLFNL